MRGFGCPDDATPNVDRHLGRHQSRYNLERFNYFPV
jgi:hypothetical protein